MTVAYGSKRQPKELFGDGTQDHIAFYKAMETVVPGPMMLMDFIQSKWDKDKEYLDWIMPNGAHVHIAVLDKLTGNVSMTIDSSEVTIPFETTVRRPVKKGLSLAANVTHSIDAYIKDLIVIDFKENELPITTVHDAFGVHPNDVAFLMNSYRAALVKVYEDQVLRNIMRQITGNSTLELPTMSSHDYAEEIKRSVYALS